MLRKFKSAIESDVIRLKKKNKAAIRNIRVNLRKAKNQALTSLQNIIDSSATLRLISRREEKSIEGITSDVQAQVKEVIY